MSPRGWSLSEAGWVNQAGKLPGRTRAGMQSYHIEDGKLAETWVLFQPPGSAWSDALAQDSWTSPHRVVQADG